MPTRTLVDHRGNPIILGMQLGKGGEGAVFEVHGNPSVAAKIYLNSPDPEKSTKIITMVGVGNDRLLKLTAWPLQSIHSPKGKLVGFSMQKLQGYRPLFELYSPKLRLQKFPQADWRFLIHTAMNTARAFSVIHESGHVIGDVNHGNLLVGKDSTVKFIDTDSFQISVNEKNWLCDVGVATHQPPEMQGLATYRGLIRTPNHDNFGLAVLIFQLLCLARHPFSGRFSGKGDMPLEKAIAEFRFAYSKDSHWTQMQPPPASLPMEALGHNIRSLFDRAFSKGSVGNRPTARGWVSALETLLQSLKPCSLNPGHYYLSSVVSCPWCNIEKQSGVLVFPLITASSKCAVSFESLWQQIIGIAHPNPAPLLPDVPSIKVSPSNDAVEIEKKVKKLRARCLIYLIYSLGLFFICSVLQYPLFYLAPVSFIFTIFAYYKFSKVKLVKPISEQLSIAQSAWDDITHNWDHKVGDSRFAKVRQNLDALKWQYDDLPRERQQDLQKLWQNRRQLQFIQYLGQCRIESAKLEGIGPGRSSVLQSYGIETAADIDVQKLMCISGFGPKLIQKLLHWRKQCETKFVFIPSKGISQSDLSAVDNKIVQKRFNIEKDMTNGLMQLKMLKTQIDTHHRQLQEQATVRAFAYAQALINARTVRIRL